MGNLDDGVDTAMEGLCHDIGDNACDQDKAAREDKACMNIFRHHI